MASSRVMTPWEMACRIATLLLGNMRPVGLGSELLSSLISDGDNDICEDPLYNVCISKHEKKLLSRKYFYKMFLKSKSLGV